MKKFWKRTEGFTLVELIVVIAILGILAGVGTVGYSGYVKKANMAADETLLASLNQAFATACIEYGTNTTGITDATAVLSSEYAVTGIDIVGHAKGNEIEGAFSKYFAGNESSEFKVYKSISFSPALGRFIAAEAGMKESTQNGKTYRADGTDILLYQNSTWGKTMTPQQTLDMAQNTVGLVSEMYSEYLKTMNDKGNYTAAAADALGMSEADYLTYFNGLVSDNMAQLRVDEPTLTNRERKDKAQAMAQSSLAVLVAAKDAKTESVNIISTLTKDGGVGAKEFIKENVKGDVPTTGLSQAALAYGLYNAYVQSDDTITDKESASKPGNAWANLNSTGFQNYLKTSQAKDDLAGLLAAFNAIGDQDQATIKHTVENGYNNADLSAAMDELLGSGN